MASVATALGMPEIHAVCMTHLREEVRVVYSRDVFGARVSLFGNRLRKRGVDITFVSLTQADA